MEEKPKQNLWRILWKIIAVFLIFELISQIIVAMVTNSFWHMLLNGKYSLYFISELIVCFLVTALLIMRKKWHIFKDKNLIFKDSIKLGMPILFLSIIMLASASSTIVGKINWSNFLSMALYCATIGFFEEILYRGIIEKELLEGYGDTRKKAIISIVLSALIFSSMHLTNLLFGQDFLTTLMQVIQTFAIGILLGSMYYVSNNIWSVIFLHGFYDFSVMLSDVNLIKDCHYASNLPFKVMTSSLVASIILSTIYIVYSLMILNKSNMSKVLDIEVTEEDKKKEFDQKKIISKIIFLLVIAFFSFNVIYNTFILKDSEDYYICYTYEEKEINKIETHYYNYNEFDISKDDLIYNLSIKNFKVAVKSMAFKTEQFLNINNVEKLLVVDDSIVIVTNDLGNYKIYYSSYFKENDIINLDDLNNSFQVFDVPEIVALGYLIDAKDNIKYLMVKSNINDFFVIENDKIFIVKN